VRLHPDDRIDAGTLTPSTSYFTTATDQLWGGDYFGSATLDGDTFRFVAGSATVESFGTSYFNAAALVADFNPVVDELSFARGLVGDNDATIELGSIDSVAGGTFDKDSELVIFTTDVAATFNYSQTTVAYFNAATVTAVIGSADAAFTVGAERLFAVDNGTSSAIFGFVSANADAAVTANELSLIAVVANQPSLALNDFSLF